MKHFLKKHSILLTIFCAALIIRIVSACIFSQANFTINEDIMRYQDWGRIAYVHGAAATYTTQYLSFGAYPNNQPPGTLYIDLAMYSLYQLFAKNASTTVYIILLKAPNILADLLIGFMIFSIVIKKTNPKYALIASSLFLFNPVVIYNSAIWGQTDALNNAFFFLSLTFLFNKRYSLSILFFFFSLYIKLSLLPLLPVLLLILLRRMHFAFIKLLIYVPASIAALLFLTLPVSLTPHLWIIEFFLKSSGGELPYITNYTFNFWSMLFNPDSFSLIPLSSDIYFGLPLFLWAYFLFGLTFIPLLIHTLTKKNIEKGEIMGILFLAAFAVFLLMPRMHQRYIYPAIPLMATYIGLTRKNYNIYVALSAVNFVNLYVVYHPSDFLPLFFTNFIAHSKIRLGMSVAIVGLFVISYIKILLNTKIANKQLDTIEKYAKNANRRDSNGL